jgi:hypothetical protein
VLTVILFAVGGQLVGPLVQRFRDQSVWAEYLARAFDFAGTMSQDEPEAASDDRVVKAAGDSTGPARAARRPGASDPAALPKDLPVHPAPLEALYNVGPTHVVVFQRVAGSRTATIEQFREEMQRQGWKVTSETPGEWSTIIRWAKGTRSCMIEFADDSANTEVWLRSMMAASTSRR